MGRFFDKLEKLDVLTIIFVVIVCLFALAVMYGWPKGEWAFGWTALAAIGGLAAGVGAFYAAIVALKVSAHQAEREKETKKLKAEIAAFSLAPRLRLVKNQLRKCLKKYLDGDILDLGNETSDLINLINDLDNQDITHYADLNKLAACTLAEAKSYINGFYDIASSTRVPSADERAKIFYVGANGHRRLEIYCNDLEWISRKMFDYNMRLQENTMG